MQIYNIYFKPPNILVNKYTVCYQLSQRFFYNNYFQMLNYFKSLSIIMDFRQMFSIFVL